MAAITPTKKYSGQLAGEEQIKAFEVVPGSASDTVDLSTYLDTIHSVTAVITAGQDANLMSVHPSFVGTTVTIATLGADGLAATDWTGAKVTLHVLGTADGV